MALYFGPLFPRGKYKVVSGQLLMRDTQKLSVLRWRDDIRSATKEQRELIRFPRRIAFAPSVSLYRRF